MFSGKLSHLPESGKNYFYGGVLSSITRQPNVEEDLDILISVSGPEPQRTVFEEKILKEIHHLPGRKVVVLGKTEVVSLIEDAPNLKVYSHIPRQQMELLVNKARLVISRPGYSTLMELAELGKRALLVPTPGQTEQDYLAQLMMSNQWFYCVTQNKLDLGKDVEIAKTFSGLYLPNATQNTVNKVFNTLL
ncbi:MAG: hypothetical protein GWN62_36045 [Aliifodinibius sp.]|nr:hypothetical protein [Fodinibius sp.]NIW80321.1 hypothetical protein [Calditrichia bacterium]